MQWALSTSTHLMKGLTFNDSEMLEQMTDPTYHRNADSVICQ